MRVLLTTDTVGGVWTFTKELTQQLLTQGHSVALVSFGRSASAEQMRWARLKSTKYADQFFFRECAAPLEWMQDNASAWDEGAALIIKIAEEFKAEILHSNQFCWGALQLAIPKILTAHSDVLSWAAACGNDGLESSAWSDRYKTLVRSGVCSADALVAPTAWMRDAFCTHFAVSAPFHVIPNGRTIPERDVDGSRELRAVSVGRLWDEAKGLVTLRGVVSPMPILLAGEACFEGGGIGDLGEHVSAVGTLDEISLFGLFASSSVYLATSLYEPFGLAPLEAALCGCAVVARDLPSFREVWGNDALYFADARALTNVLEELAGDPIKLVQAQIAATERARLFTSERMASSYVSLYDELIASRARSLDKCEVEMYAA